MVTSIHTPHFVLSPAILAQVAAIDEFKGSWPTVSNLPPERLAELEQRTVCQAVAAGLRLSGDAISDQQVATVLAGGLLPDQSGVTENIAGHAKVLRLLISSSTTIPLTENLVKQLHRILAKPSAGDKRGVYRRTDGEDIGEQMRQLLAWTNDTIQNGQLHPLLLIAAFLLRFLFIHPFAEDNQRLSRLLTLLLLLRCDYPFHRYHALPAVIEEQNETYEKGLMEGLDRLDSDNTIAEAWLQAFFDVLLRQTTSLRTALQQAQKATSRHSLDQQILDHLRSHGQTTNKLIQEATGGNRNTIKVRLRMLVERGELIKHGTGKGTRYTLGQPA